MKCLFRLESLSGVCNRILPVTKQEFLELLRRVKAERLLSSETDILFEAAKGDRYSLSLNFIQFSSVLGSQINSEYDNGFKFECTTGEGSDVVVLFQDKFKEFADSLRGQNAREIKVKVLGYDSLYQKPILGYFEEEITEQESSTEPDTEPNTEGNLDPLPNSKPHHWGTGYNKEGRAREWPSVRENEGPINEGAQKPEKLPPKPKSNLFGVIIWGVSIAAIMVLACWFSAYQIAKLDSSKPSKKADPHAAQEAFLLEWYKNTSKAEASFENGQLVTARQLIGNFLYLRKKKGFEPNKGMDEVLTYRSYYLLGKIYDLLEDSYKSCQNFLKAKNTASNPYRYDRRELEGFIERQFLKLKEQGMGGLIDETRKALKPVNQKWLDSVVEIAADETAIDVTPDGETIVLIQTMEPYSGWVKFFHDSGAIKELIHYDHGQRHGHYRSWKIDGSVASIATYHKGKKTGLNPTFGDDGKAYNIPMYRDGKLLEPRKGYE